MKKPQLPFTALAAAMLICLGPVWAGDEMMSDEELALELIEVTNSAAIGAQMGAAMFGTMRPMFPQVPEDVWTELLDILDPAELAELMVPIFVRHYTREDMEGLLEFYRSPLGQRLIETMPAVMQDSMAAGQEWGRRKAEEIIERLRARGFEPTTTS